MNIEDRGAPAFSTNQPIALAGIAEAEGATADFAAGHVDVTAGTKGHSTFDEFGANGLQLGGSVLRGVVGH
jgi:hypothetical protein